MVLGKQHSLVSRPIAYDKELAPLLCVKYETSMTLHAYEARYLVIGTDDGIGKGRALACLAPISMWIVVA